ncbi:MAG: HAMP domain-containing sensor histidine kinase [Verrucomicrobiae bacterium]|nr:HAMP domain-containing sensor histidine kinase [Verrucomicrobiae bacterium]
MKKIRQWWGRLSLQWRLGMAFGVLGAGVLVFLAALLARTHGVEFLAKGKIVEAFIFALVIFFVGGWLIAGWSLGFISQLGIRFKQNPNLALPAELEGLANLLRSEMQKHDSLLAELRHFTSDASHELRTPLTAIRTVGEVALRNSQAKPEELREAIESILEECQRMNALVERLLRLARVESDEIPLRLRRINLRLHCFAWKDAISVLAEEKNLSFDIQCPPDLFLVTDVEMLGHAVVNLLHNAIEHNPPQGTITFRVEKLDNQIILEISDEGRGIEPEHIDKIFRRFYRANRSRSYEKGSGFGLGLSIAKAAVERLGGNISVTSVLGRGASFKITLPASG